MMCADDVLVPAWRPLSGQLVNRLTRAGVLTDGEWRDALLSIPRHHFIPAYYEPAAGQPGGWRMCTQNRGIAGGARWLAQIYTDIELTTALTGLDLWGVQAAASVSPAPSTTMTLLHALDVHRSSRVLEIGTGSGHVAGLLAHRLGAPQVTTVEIDPDLHEQAGERLAELGLRPRMIRADSTRVLTGIGEFDRILVEHTVDHVPASWVRLTRPDAAVLLRLSGGLGAGHQLLLRRAPDGQGLVGRFLPWAAPLPPHRPAAGWSAGRGHPRVADAPRATSSTPFPPGLLGTNTPLLLLCQLTLPPGTTHVVRPDDTGRAASYLTAPDGSWAEIRHRCDHGGRHELRRAGTRDLAAALERAYAQYQDLGRPGWEEFGVSATGRCSHVWHRDPTTGLTWALPPQHPASSMATA